MRIPNTYLRTGIITALNGIGAPVWGKVVPKDVTPVPELYVLIRTQDDESYEKGKDCWEWLCTITIDIIYAHEAGYSDTETLDQLQENIMSALETNPIVVEYFRVNSFDFLHSQDLDLEDETQLMERKVLVYTSWVAQDETIVEVPTIPQTLPFKLA